MEEKRICKQCGEEKLVTPENFYHYHKEGWLEGRFQIHTLCKACEYQNARERNKRNFIPKWDPNRKLLKDMSIEERKVYDKIARDKCKAKKNLPAKTIQPKAIDTHSILKKLSIQEAKGKKAGKQFELGFYNHTKIDLEVLNTYRFNTVQAMINTWIKVDPGVSQMDLDRCLLIFKKTVKQRIKEIPYTYFKKESIVSFRTSNINKKTMDKQFLDMDIVFFVNDDSIYDKHTILKILDPFLKSIVDDVLHNDNNCFKISNVYGDKRTIGRQLKF